MLNRRNGFKTAVHAPLGAGPYVLVPREQVDQVRYLLITNGIGHTVDDRMRVVWAVVGLWFGEISRFTLYPSSFLSSTMPGRPVDETRLHAVWSPFRR